ncbi:MAG TPA: hypothetical protein VIY73_18560 [Polyangiaceae bacterium]
METKLAEVFESRHAWVVPRRRARVERRADRMRKLALHLASHERSREDEPSDGSGKRSS